MTDTATSTGSAPRYASPVDYDAHGLYGPGRGFDKGRSFRRPVYRFQLFGAQITEADVRLWPTLARFDTGYNPLAGVTERRLTEFPQLWGYARDLYRLPAFRETTSPRSAAWSGGRSRRSSPTRRGGSVGQRPSAASAVS
jgi:hypothetical protein